MSVPDSIIVYRNPAEKALWEMLMSGEFFVVIVACVVLLAMTLFADAQLQRFGVRRVLGVDRGYVALWIGIATSVAVGYIMWI